MKGSDIQSVFSHRQSVQVSVSSSSACFQILILAEMTAVVWLELRRYLLPGAQDRGVRCYHTGDAGPLSGTSRKLSAASGPLSFVCDRNGSPWYAPCLLHADLPGSVVPVYDISIS